MEKARFRAQDYVCIILPRFMSQVTRVAGNTSLLYPNVSNIENIKIPRFSQNSKIIFKGSISSQY